MALRQSKVVLCIAVYVFVMVLFAEAQNVARRQIIVANAGENISLSCNMHTTSTIYIYWVKDNHNYIAGVNEDHPQGWFYNSHFTQSYDFEISSGLFILYIYDAKAETATYACRDGIAIQEYDVRVIGCPACFVNLSASHRLEHSITEVNCHLNNFHTAERIRINITMNRDRTNTAFIKGSILTFDISITMMYSTIQVEFNPFTDALSNITCIIPAQLTTPQSYTSVKVSPSTSLIAISATSSSETSTTKSGTVGTTTTRTKSYDSTPKSSSSPITDTSYLTFGTITSNHTRRNINSGTENNNKHSGIKIITIAILGSILIIAVIVIIFVLRLKQRRDRQQGERNEGEINVSVDDNVASDREQDTCYESIGGSSGIRHNELMDNVLYEANDGIIQSSILRSGRDTDLYTIPDKTGIINRVAKSESVSVSSNGNSSMNRHQHEQKEFKQVGAGDDDDTNIPLYAIPDKGPKSTRNTRKTRPGSASTDDGADIPLYAMPDKGPRSTINTMNTSPGSASTEDGADIPLYALPDKRPGSKGNIIRTTPGPGTQTEGDEIPLYAVLNKEPGSKDNRPTVKPKPGDQSKALNKDDDKEALYAVVDKSN